MYDGDQATTRAESKSPKDVHTDVTPKYKRQEILEVK